MPESDVLLALTKTPSRPKKPNAFSAQPEPLFTILFRRWPLGCPEKGLENGQGYSKLTPAGPAS